MTNQFYAIKKLGSVVLGKSATDMQDSERKVYLISINAELANLGYILDQKVYNSLLKNLSMENVIDFQDAFTAIRKIKGADVEYTPMYPNFPRQVAEMDELELYLNAFMHYWSYGAWKPDYEKLPRAREIEFTEFKTLGVVTEDEFKNIFTTILSSNESISDEDREIINWFAANYSDLVYPDVIPYKENLCVVVGNFLDKGMDVSGLITNTTDVLRVMTYISGGDVSLAGNTKFKSLNRQQRRILVRALERVATLEDLNRHRSKWIRALHSLHVGDYSKKLFDLASVLRSNETIETWNSRVEAALKAKKPSVIGLLMERPTEFARRLDVLLREPSFTADIVLDSFERVTEKIPTRVICQVFGHFQKRDQDVKNRVVFPKGSTQKAKLIDNELSALPTEVVERVQDTLAATLVDRFKDMEPLGKVFVDDALYDCPLPTQMRSASTGAYAVARGTRLPVGDKGTLRFFIYWKGQDIDLSATFHDEDFNYRAHVSYTNLRQGGFCYHSGDITWAPNGASEFIDIDIDKALKAGHRYVAMTVYVYSGPFFAEHDACYAGWMTRDKPNSNEIYEPSTVQQKLDLTGEARMAIPVVFDLLERKAISVDLYSKGREFSWGSGRIGGLNYGGNNVERNNATIEQVLKSISMLKDTRMEMGSLCTLHGLARGKIVANREDADYVFALDDEADINPFMVNEINTKLVA